uniref:guanylate cyclase n=1 Tax=Panagrolaimus davidi TaxID=227884 RepID=A0A914PIK8_9BILA
MVSGRTMNLMDHVFNMLESYASSLEEEVEERTKELVEEKKKSDVLLYRMLPKQVAEKLKLGQSVEPETFECVTIFFSDVVSFTTLASRCTPLQVVNLLNDLYTVFDGIIAEYDVYKVETIGDGYLCVSGLPHRNGNAHAKHIANMSLSFMKSLERYTIPHLPGERISLRIGLHTGGVVTGVVGLAMPRYCLFGDTVNTASRMESNGKPNRIHLSAEANKFLTNITGGFITESRGEVIIKGKGVMETFWLVGTTNEGELVSGIQASKTVEDRNPPMYESFKKSQS